MDPFFNGTGKTGTGQESFTRKNLSEPFHFLSEPFHFFVRVNGPVYMPTVFPEDNDFFF